MTEGTVGVEVFVAAESRVIQFYTITSAVKGYGRKMVAAVVGTPPADWQLVAPMDWSGGFWRRMAEEYPHLAVG